MQLVLTTLSRWAVPAAVVGGMLWVPYGVFEMLEPWGAATVYQEDLGYQLISHIPLFVVYSLPGALAVLLTALGLLGLATRFGLPVARLGRAGLILAYVAVGLAILSMAGVLVLFAPLFFGGLVFGSLFLGAATFILGIDARRAGTATRWANALVIVRVMGLFLLPLRPLVYAIELVPKELGAAFIALFGLGWVGVGYALWSDWSERHGGTSGAAG